MKLNIVVVISAFVTLTTAFTPSTQYGHAIVSSTCSSLYMFGGAGAGVPSEDDPAAMQRMEQEAKALGMAPDEYKIGMSARMRLTAELDSARCKGGDATKIMVERDGNNPPKYLEIIITEEGKKIGPDGVSKELVSALKKASDESRNVRTAAQKNMMAWIADEMKRMGSM
jgi:hypothetical protein